MRINKAIKNIIYAGGTYIILGIISIIVRKMFLNNLTVDFLGYDGLFGNIFSFFMLADLNIEGLILYRLFPAYNAGDKVEVSSLISMYKYLYKLVGVGIAIIGVVVAPFLQYIIRENSLSWCYIYVIYFIQLGITLSTYFLGYKRLLFSVAQAEYVVTKVDFVTNLLVYIARILVIVFTGNYILYLVCGLSGNIIGNIVINIKSKKDFREIIITDDVKLRDIKEAGFWVDIRNNISQKFGMTVYGATDNIIITYLLGITVAGLYSNYILIQSYITTFLTRILKPLSMGIGDYIYSEEYEKGEALFKMFDLLSFFLASVVCAVYICLFNPTIEVLFGAKFIMTQAFVVAFSVNQYIAWNHLFLGYYRMAFGNYEKDKLFILVGAFLNIFVSLLAGKYFGITGIMVGTVVGHMGFWIGRCKIVYSHYIRENIYKYVMRQCFRGALCFFECMVAYRLCLQLSISIIGIFVRFIIVVLVTVMINIVVFVKTNEYNLILSYVKIIIHGKK